MHTSKYQNSIEAGLLPIENMDYRSVISRVSHLSTVMRIWNQWVTEGHAKWHAGSRHPPMTNAHEDTHIVMFILQNCITTSTIISQEMGMLGTCPDSARMVCRRVQQRGLSARRSLLQLCLDTHRKSTNDKTVYRNGTMSSFQRNLGSSSSILRAIFVSESFEETTRRLLAFDISIGALYLV